MIYPQIDWELLSEAKKFYSKSFNFIEVPWTVENNISAVTTPLDKKPFKTPIGDLVGSAEQSFISLMSKNKIDKGRWATITPCFRDDKEDELHQKYFMKLELIDISDEPDYFFLLNIANDFFNKMIETQIIDIEKSFYPQKDIACAKTGIELGSYGLRRWGKFSWAYGTGLAEPRFSFVRSKLLEIK